MEENILKSKYIVALAAVLFPVGALAGPSQCWYYLHNELLDVSLSQCVGKAESALNNRGYETSIRNSSDNFIIYVRSETNTISADVLCYEVNGTRGDVMAFITVAGNGSCAVAKDIFTSISNN